MEHITSRSNPLLSKVRKLIKDRSYRRETGEFVCDGVKMLEEAVKWQADVTAVILTEELTLDFPLPKRARCVTVPADVMASVSPMKAPQGALFLCRMNSLTAPERLEGRTWLVLDGLQDPGNVGTIWRTADAFGADALLLTGHSADPYNWKTVRASMGAVFRLKAWELEPDELTALCRRSGAALVGTALREDTVSLKELPAGPCAMVIGSEGHGISQEMLEACDLTVKIPMKPTCESLNAAVAASVLLWERWRSAAD